MMFSALLVCAAVAALPISEGASSDGAASEGANQIVVAELSIGQQIEIVTTQRHYRAEIVDPRSGEARASVSDDGVHFSTPAKVYLIGATRGRYPEMLVSMGRLLSGQRIELGLGSLAEQDRALSEPVTSMRLVAP